MNYVDFVNPGSIIYFASSDKDPAGFEVEMLAKAINDIPSNRAMKLTYSVTGKATINKPFVQPTATVNYISLKDSYKNELIKFNKIGSTPAEDEFTILLSPRIPKYEKRLYEVLILKKLLKMNPDHCHHSHLDNRHLVRHSEGVRLVCHLEVGHRDFQLEEGHLVCHLEVGHLDFHLEVVFVRQFEVAVPISLRTQTFQLALF